jgi:hypothetical protein
MDETKSPVVVAVDEPNLRRTLTDALVAAGYEVTMVVPAYELCNRPVPKAVIVLETKDDVAMLTQIVYELYMASPRERPPAILAILSLAVINAHPSVALWMIHGHVALLSLQYKCDKLVSRVLRILEDTGPLKGW